MAVKKSGTAKAKIVNTPKQEPFTPKPVKAKFNAGTWITVLIFLTLVGVSIYLNRQKNTAEVEATPASEPVYLFSANVDGNPASIEVKPAEGETAKIVLDEKNVWAIELPRQAEADQGLAQAAAAQISALMILDPVEGDPAIFGLNNPASIISLEFSDGKKHTLEIGDSTPSNNGYYVRVDNEKMLIVDISGIDSLLQLAAFPPYLSTPTPTSLPPTETPVPPTQAISTPEANTTPTP